MQWKQVILNYIRNNNNSLVADLVLVFFGIFYFFSAGSGSTNLAAGLSPEEISVQFLIILTVVPWYVGYLLFHFDQFKKRTRIFLQWISALIILALIVFLILLLFPLIDSVESPTPGQVFLVSFGMFFLVLGPLMLLGGYADHAFFDGSPNKDEPYPWPQVTLVMFIIIFAILFMVLIIGWFDPTWKGDAGFGVVMLGFFGGPLLAVIAAIPFMMIGKWIERNDKNYLTIHISRFLFPFLIFNSLIWWNDIVLNYMLTTWEIAKPDFSVVFWSLTLGGILPFRLLLLVKPPLSWFALFSGLISIGLFLWSVLVNYQAG